MSTIRMLALASLAIVSPLQAEPFQGLKQLLSTAEWQRAGLDRLSPDELGVIDAALIRHLAALEHKTTPAPERQPSVAVSPIDRLSDPKSPQRSTLERFGLPNLLEDVDWRKLPPLRARVAAWAGGNRFKLDNGQIWEGAEPIPYDLPGSEIEIQARPFGQFTLLVNGKDTRLRIIRLR